MKKGVFVSLLKGLKAESDKAFAISGGINEVFRKNGREFMEEIDLSEAVFSYEFSDLLVSSLKEEFSDDGDLIGNFIYENNWGAEAGENEPRTIEELYDALVLAMPVETPCDRTSCLAYNVFRDSMTPLPSARSGRYLMLEDIGCYSRGDILKRRPEWNVPERLYVELTWDELRCGCCGMSDTCGRIRNILDDYDNNSMF